MKLMLLVLPTLLVLTGAAAPVSPWEGTWRLDQSRSSPESWDGAPPTYRFRVDAAGRLTWEIPSRGEVVTGRLDGRPMPVSYPGAPASLMLAVKAVGEREWTYSVYLRGRALGGGRMVMIEGGKAWADLTWGREGPGHGLLLVYVKDAPRS